jgi:carboxyl-terminal processing protease
MLMNTSVMSHKAFLAAAGILILLLGFALGTRSEQIFGAAGQLIGLRTSAATLDDSELQATYRALKASYNGTLSEEALLEGAQHGLVEAAGDDYTVYMSKKEADEFQKDLTGDIGGGIGAEIGMRSEMPTVIRTLPDNPAEKAGVHAGDIITAVNGDVTEEWSVEKTVAAIRGEAGTTVKLTVQRGEQTKEITITREIVNNPSVSTELRGDIGIITLSRFDQDTVGLFRKSVEDLKRRGMKKLVLDMRGNGGGYLESAPGVVGAWVEDKPVVSVRANQGGSETLNAEGDATLKSIKTAVMVNEGTASAAEIVAAALKHYGVATIVGTKTFGKGSVQELVPLPHGAMLKVTIKRWYTPANTNIDGKGITPEIKAGLTQKDLDAGKDPQLNAALKTLR